MTLESIKVDVAMVLVYLKQLSVKSLLGSILQVFGVLWLLIETTAYFFSDRSWAASIKEFWWLFFILGIVIGIYQAWPKISVKSRISGTDVDVEVRIGDIFSLNGTAIIGSNSTFDTALEDGTISRASVQGQFTTRFCSSLSDLDNKLDESLRNINPTGMRSNADKPYGKTTEYELGTVAQLEVGGKRAYFVAVARLNEHRVANSDRDSFLDALPRMWEGIRSREGIEPLCCPVLGSGFSRLNITRQKLIQEIIKSFVAASIEGKFNEKLTIVVSSEDFEDGHVDLHKIERFLEHECDYAKLDLIPTSSGPIGAPLD